jgi:predicted RNA-binding Zn-ribbon protein involved in translation (DUF1610 family)
VEIKVRIPSRGKTATLEVESNHGVGSIVEVLCEELGLGDNRRWNLISGERAMGNSKTMRELSVHNGDRFELVQSQTERSKETQLEAIEKQVKEETAFLAEDKCSCGKRLTWISDYGRFYCYRCKKYPPQCSTCKKDLFWVPEYTRYYCNACGSYAPKTSLAL